MYTVLDLSIMLIAIITSDWSKLSVIALLKNGWLLKWPKKQIQLSPVVPYFQILVICGHDYYIVSLYGSWTTKRYYQLSKQTTRA